MSDIDREALDRWSGASPHEEEAMTPAELRVVIEWLGLRQRDAAALLGVHERTIRSWLAGRDPIPDGVRLDLEAIEAETARAVGEVVTALGDMRDPAILVPRTDKELWEQRPDAAPLPASWWRMVVARAVTEVPGVAIDYPEDE